VTVLGALGGKRFDHAMANVGLLSLPAPEDAEVELLDASHGSACSAPPAPAARPSTALSQGPRAISSRCCR